MGQGFVAPNAHREGTVRLGDNASVWFGAVLRGTEADVELGDGCNVQDNCLVEGTPGHPARLARRVAMGHNARVRGASIDENTLIAIGASVEPGARVESECIVAANATVPAGMRVPARSLVIGQGRIRRQVTEAEVARIHHTVNEYLRLSSEYVTAAD